MWVACRGGRRSRTAVDAGPQADSERGRAAASGPGWGMAAGLCVTAAGRTPVARNGSTVTRERARREPAAARRAGAKSAATARSISTR